MKAIKTEITLFSYLRQILQNSVWYCFWYLKGSMISFLKKRKVKYWVYSKKDLYPKPTIQLLSTRLAQCRSHDPNLFFAQARAE
jgi:hypothetical protein